MPKRLVLGIDTCGQKCSVALVSNGKTVGKICETQERERAERLFPMCFELLSRAGRSWHDIDALAVITGPGHSTGIRLAISAARGLSLSLNKPAVGISSFEAIAYGSNSSPCHVLFEAPHGRAHSQTLPNGKMEFGRLENLPRPSAEVIVIGQNMAQRAAKFWGCHWQKPKWPMAEAAAMKVASMANLSMADPPVPNYHSEAV